MASAGGPGFGHAPEVGATRQWPAATTAAALAATAAASFLLGRLSATERRRCVEESEGTVGKAAQPGVAVASPPKIGGGAGEAGVPEQELLRLLRQLPHRPLGPRGDAQAPHSAVRLAILCASGKGGVGKSTVSVNLAFALQQLGLDVGLVDLDVYGPSLPELVRMPPDSAMQTREGLLIPIDYAGVALMSWGYLSPGEAATIRAPIATRLVTQLLTGVKWGALDVLVIDSPPGTGDVLLTLSQTLTVDGAVLVTTANTLSLADVAKGLQLFEKVDIPPMMVVVNMASSRCESCGHEQPLFADGAIERLPELLRGRRAALARLPLEPALSVAPAMPLPPATYAYPFIRNPDHEASPAAVALRRLALELLQTLLAGAGGPGGGAAGAANHIGASLRLRPGGQLELRLRGGELWPVSCNEVRAQCRCAECVDDMTGEMKIDQDRIRGDTALKAKDVQAVGNYAASVLFSDGHSTLVALRALEAMCGAGAGAGQAQGEAVAW